jgi:hypothetical protein
MRSQRIMTVSPALDLGDGTQIMSLLVRVGRASRHAVEISFSLGQRSIANDALHRAGA